MLLLLHCNNYNYKLFIYSRFKLIYVKGQLERDEILLDISSVPLSPILLSLKIRK
jgi:hypothetical protein